jgi:hypothetical protein
MEGGLTLPAAAQVAKRFVNGEAEPDGCVRVARHAHRVETRSAAWLAVAVPENAPRRGRPRTVPGRTARQRLVAYGDDPSLLKSAARRTAADRS